MMRRGDALSLQIVPFTIRGRAINGEAIDACGDALKNLWVFICAPLVGGALSALVWKYFAK